MMFMVSILTTHSSLKSGRLEAFGPALAIGCALDLEWPTKVTYWLSVGSE